MKTILTMVFWMMATGAQAVLSVSQTFSPEVQIPNGNPVGVVSEGTFTAAPAGSPAYSVVGISVTLNISGGYNGTLYACLVAPNGTAVTLMNQPGVTADGFGAESSGMNVTLEDTAGLAIQSQTGGYGSSLSGTYQPDEPLGTMGGSKANGVWEIYFADLGSGGGDAELNSWSLNLAVVPEPVAPALVIFLLVLVADTGWRNWRKKEKTGEPHWWGKRCGTGNDQGFI